MEHEDFTVYVAVLDEENIMMYVINDKITDLYDFVMIEAISHIQAIKEKYHLFLAVKSNSIGTTMFSLN